MMKRTKAGLLIPKEPDHMYKGFRFEITEMTGYWHGVAVAVELGTGFKAVGISERDVAQQLQILIDHLPEVFFQHAYKDRIKHAQEN